MAPATTTSLRASGATDVGRQRSGNEDRFFVDADRGIFIVVDGIGGHAAGETAADTAIATMTERLARQTGPVEDRLREAITIANNEIHRLASTRPDWRGMACVLTAAVVDHGRVVVGHVGDSRMYLVQGDELRKITPDHSPVGEREDANEISEFEAMRHPRRNEVYRDVGSEPHAVGDPDFVFITDLSFGEGSGLLLCSDGLTDLVPSETIRATIRAHANSPADVVRALIAAANDAGGKDNVTVIYVEHPWHTPHVTPGSQPQIDGRMRESSWRPWIVGLLALIIGVGIGGFWRGPWLPDGLSSATSPLASGTIVVRSTESIGAAVARATAGSTVLVEPGEYREQLFLRDNIRVVSRVPRGATLRLPGTANEGDAAVVGAGVVNAEVSGFRIVGDAATPLGVGVIVRDSSVRLLDLAVTGAGTVAIDLGAGDGTMLVGSDVHDNAGSAVIVRAGATPRLANNVFTRNAGSERSAGAFAVEPGATPEWSHNVFNGIGPLAIQGLDDATRLALPRTNWFIATPPATTAPAGARRGGRGR